jgi:hypothetical protein
VSAPSITSITSVSTATARARTGKQTFWLAGAYYLVAAIAMTMWLWWDPASRIVAANPFDADQSAWFLKYDATAIAHLHLPALSTVGMNAPHGINLMWNTPMMLPGVVLAPLTLAAGPQVSLTLLMTLGFAGSALAMFGVLRYWGASPVASGAGGLVYGFSPALIQSALGHYDLQFAVLPPLIVHAALRLAIGSPGAGRSGTEWREAGRRGAWLGLLMAAQVFIAEESLFDSAVAAAILLAVLAASRPSAARRLAGDALAGAAAAAVVVAVVAGYPLWEQFFGPVRQHGSPFAPDFYKNDLAGFVQPSSLMLVHTRSTSAFASAFQGQPPEYLGYLGWPMLAVLAVLAVRFWRLLPVRATAITFAVLEVFSLGGTLLAGGHEHAWLKLPWYWTQALPVAISVIPDRFSILADGAAAALFAFGLDAARQWFVTRQRLAARQWLVAGIALAALVPLVPRPLAAAHASPVPDGWTATFASLRLPTGAPVLIVPVPRSGFTEPLRWQADTGVPASMIGGYFMGPDRTGQAATDGEELSPEGEYLNLLWARSSGDGTVRDAGHLADEGIPDIVQMRAQIAAWKPAAIVVVTGRHSVLGRYLTGLLGPPTADRGDVLGWRI